jgi:hypothetical protein
MLSPYSNPAAFYPRQMRILGGQTLSESIRDGIVDEPLGLSSFEFLEPNFREDSLNALLHLQLIEACETLPAGDYHSGECLDFTATATPSGYRPARVGNEARPSCAKLWMMWELRSHLPESLVLGDMLPRLHREFLVGRADRDGDTVPVQVQFCLFLILLCERQPFVAGGLETGHCSEPLMEHPFVHSYQLQGKLAEWEGEIAALQDRIGFADVFGADWMLLRPDVAPGSPLDATLFDCIAHPDHALTLPHTTKQYVREALTSLSVKLSMIHNNLMRDKDPVRDNTRLVPGRYAQFESITRKCFTRLQHISRALIQDIVDFDDATSV